MQMSIIIIIIKCVSDGKQIYRKFTIASPHKETLRLAKKDIFTSATEIVNKIMLDTVVAININ